jgi:hypothetical protein
MTNLEKAKKNKEALLESLEKSLGVVTTACKAAGISRDTYYRYMKDDPEFAGKVNELQEVSLDFAESQLFKLMQNGNPASIIFYLKTKGKKRGYIENAGIAMQLNGGQLNVVVEKPEDKDEINKFLDNEE